MLICFTNVLFKIFKFKAQINMVISLTMNIACSCMDTYTLTLLYTVIEMSININKSIPAIKEQYSISTYRYTALFLESLKLFYVYSKLLRKKHTSYHCRKFGQTYSFPCEEGRNIRVTTKVVHCKRDTASKIRFNYLLGKLKCPEVT
jgi:hypothetical protein